MTEEERDEIIVLTDEEGTEYEFQIIDVLEVDGKRYAVLFPLEEDAEDDEALIMRLETDENGDDILIDIEEDEEWEKVVAEWERILEEEDDEDEDEEEPKA
ncbi:MAG: hypothetical protein FD169_438 [Bacillota bacterium]|nr:MAG: hypothetical protein FD169_438 [Bacillota bacterium]